MRASYPERQMRFACFVAVAFAALACRAHPEARNPAPALRTRPPLHLTFVPQSDTFAAAAREYTELWAVEGERIVRAME
jgi:hypothetical protein